MFRAPSFGHFGVCSESKLLDFEYLEVKIHDPGEIARGFRRVARCGEPY
jgi:hypothetical protein